VERRRKGRTTTTTTTTTNQTTATTTRKKNQKQEEEESRAMSYQSVGSESLRTAAIASLFDGRTTSFFFWPASNLRGELDEVVVEVATGLVATGLGGAEAEEGVDALVGWVKVG